MSAKLLAAIDALLNLLFTAFKKVFWTVVASVLVGFIVACMIIMLVFAALK
jgi:hypothetical protein